jgi:hypothetical protein
MARWTLAIGLLALVFVSTAAAADPTGTWKWSVMGKDNATVEQTAKLKLEGDKLTGTVTRGNNDTAITDGSFKDGTVAFTVTVERGGNKIVSKYSGKLDGDMIKGKIESDRGGKTNSRDWVAKRAS